MVPGPGHWSEKNTISDTSNFTSNFTSKVQSPGHAQTGVNRHTVPGPPRGPPSRPLRVPPSRPDPGPPTGGTSKVQNLFRFKLDAKSIPEALATTFRILLKFSIVLAHRRNPGVWPRRTPFNPPEVLYRSSASTKHRSIGPPRALRHASSAPHRPPSAPHRHPIHPPKPLS